MPEVVRGAYSVMQKRNHGTIQRYIAVKCSWSSTRRDGFAMPVVPGLISGMVVVIINSWLT